MSLSFSDLYRAEVLAALGRAMGKLQGLQERADMRMPVGDGQRALETAKAGAFLAEVAETADLLMTELTLIIDSHLKAFATAELVQAGQTYGNGAAVLIEALRQVARSYGLDSHDTLRKRYKEPE